MRHPLANNQVSVTILVHRIMLTVVSLANLTVLQSPYSPPTQVQRVPPTSIFSTPQSKTATPATGNTPSQQPPQQQQSTPAPAAQTPAARGPETPKVGGKWVHPALQGIDREVRKFIFGEEELKRLVVNVILLYSIWWISSKLGDRYNLHLT